MSELTANDLRDTVLQLDAVNKHLKDLVIQKSELEAKLTSLPQKTYTVSNPDGTGLRLDIKRTRRLDLKKVQEHYQPREHPDFYKLALNTKVIRAAVPADDLKECETESKAFATVTELKDEQ